MAGTVVACVGAVVRDDRGRLLLVRRAHEPGAGLWSIPGGRVEPGETAQQAIVREVEEETHLRVVLDGLAGVVERPAPGGDTYVIEDFFARVAPGTDPHALHADTDATEVGWFSVHELDQMPCVEGLVAELRRWRVVPAQRRP